MDASNPGAWKGLIRAHRMAGQTAAAESAARDCLARNPAEQECREQLASLLTEAGDYKESAEQYQALLRNGRANKSILDGLAFSLLKVGDHAQAIGLFESSLQRFGPDALINSNLGYLYRCAGNLKPAILNYRRARDLSPKDPERSHDLAFILYLARDYESAVPPFLTALRLKPDWGLAHYNLALTYWNLRQYGPALAHARAAQERGVREAGTAVRALTEQLGLSKWGSKASSAALNSK
jgi:tetratricopeptide (TPR) repeat protein